MATQGLVADPAGLAAEAATFERIAGEIKGVIARVEGTAAELISDLRGGAGTAAQTALTHYNEAALKINQELDDVTQNLQQANVGYVTSDEDQAAGIAQAMNMQGA